MSAAQHTKGPWTLRAWTSEYGLDYFVDAKSGITAVAQVLSNHMSGNPETQANARLIAAAPQLLEALESLVDAVAILATGRCPASLVREQVDKLQAARAAIAKAKGGTA